MGSKSCYHDFKGTGWSGKKQCRHFIPLYALIMKIHSSPRIFFLCIPELQPWLNKMVLCSFSQPLLKRMELQEPQAVGLAGNRMGLVLRGGISASPRPKSRTVNSRLNSLLLFRSIFNCIFSPSGGLSNSHIKESDVHLLQMLGEKKIKRVTWL